MYPCLHIIIFFFICTTSTEQLTISPRTLPMLGGTRVLISGKCFKQSTRDIECAFGIYRVKGYLTMTNSVTCVTPAMFVSGVIDVRLSLDGGSIFSYVGTVVVGDEISPVTFTTDPDGNLTITWNPSELPDVDEVDVVVYEFSSDANFISWEAINTTTRIFSNEPGRLGITIHAYPQRDVGEMSPKIGALGILARDETNSSIERRGIWSAIQPLNWLYPVNMTSWCQSWITRELTELNEWLPQRPACPCTERQARRDIGSFTVLLDCRHREAEENCLCGRTDAMLCVNTIVPSVSGAGQECCYDNDGHLIEFDGNGAGFSQRQHQRVTSPNPISGLGPVPILSHYLSDTVPYLQCCVAEGRDEQRFCELYRRVRPPNNCYNYQPPKPASAFGDPHFITFDGLNYTFNGYGEFTLANLDENEFILQARSVPMREAPNATIFTAVATKSNGSDVIHVEANGTFGMSVFFRREGRQCFEEADFTLRSTWYLRGVTVRAKEHLAVDGISISFDNGIAVKLTARNDALALFVTVTHRFKFHTQGMLGTWNDDQSDDLQRPDDVVIPVTSSMETIFYEFGNLWRVKRNESLFFYRTGYNQSLYTNYNYTPSFGRPTFSMDDRVSHVCGDDQLCAFDFAVSGSEGFASQTLNTISQFKSTSSDLLPLTCPSLLLANGRVVTTSSSPGSLATFSCDSCYNRRGPTNTTCASDGTWLQPLASCIPIELQCETPVAPSHGHVMVGGCPITYATFTCKGGYDLVGTSMMECLHDGFWSHPIPKCKIKGINMETMKLNSVHAAAIGGGAAAFVLILCLIIACLVTKQRDKRRKQALKKRLSNRWSTTRNPLYDPNASNS
nr:sushi domain-containing protein 2-like [Lytechinus pictus]